MRYFIEVAYSGENFAGFQVQDNAHTIQGELEKALHVLFRTSFQLTGSSRTDAGVHARQNYFHFDTDIAVPAKYVYNLNAILPHSISVTSIRPMEPTAHCRFDAIGRLYKYHIYKTKNPFHHGRAWFYPYPVSLDVLNKAAALFTGRHDFTSFSKRNTQVKTMFCDIAFSGWEQEDDRMVYTVRGNRFLRGMVRGLVATMLQAGRGKISVQEVLHILESRDCSKADFSAPAHGLFLEQVIFPERYFE